MAGLKGTSYTERFKEADPETLESRRADQGLSLTLKILKGIDKVKKEDFFKEMGR